MTVSIIPHYEIKKRIKKLQDRLKNLELDAAFIFEGLNMLYYGSTIQDGLLAISSKNEPILFVRRNSKLADIESPVKDIVEYKSFRRVKECFDKDFLGSRKIGISYSEINLKTFELLKKYFNDFEFIDIENEILLQRSIKSKYELDKIKNAGKLSKQIFDQIASWLKPGISEWELGLKIFGNLMEKSNFNFGRTANNKKVINGNICFGNSSLYPSTFNGPGGIRGRSSFCRDMGSSKKLSKEDIIYVDMVINYDEYSVDKTRIFALKKPSQDIKDMHNLCLEIKKHVSSKLAFGMSPAQIYQSVFDEFFKNKKIPSGFMGLGSNKVKFLGHGVGLALNEPPVIAERFTDSIPQDCVLAIEPKIAIENKGMVGSEDTYIVGKNEVVNVTEDREEILVV